MLGAVRIIDQVTHQDLDSVVGCGDMRGPMWRWAPDPAEALPPCAFVPLVEICRCHQDPVPSPEVLEGERTVMGEGGIDGAEVVGDPHSRATDGRIYGGDRDELRRSDDRLDPAGSHTFGRQDQASDDLEAWIVADGRCDDHPLGATGIPLGRHAERSEPGDRGGNERVDGPAPISRNDGAAVRR